MHQPRKRPTLLKSSTECIDKGEGERALEQFILRMFIVEKNLFAALFAAVAGCYGT